MPRASADGTAVAPARGQAVLAHLAWTAFVGCALMALATWLGPRLVQASLPAWGAVIESLAPDFVVTDMGLSSTGSDHVVTVEVALARSVYLGGRVQRPDPQGRATARAPWGHAAQGPLAALMLALAWPAAGARVRFLRVALLMPWLVALWLLDLPITLASSLWDLVLSAMAPDTPSPLLAASTFLGAGGRVALALTLAALAIHLASTSGPASSRHR